MTRDRLWALLQAAAPGIRRVARADVPEDAVIYAETLEPQSGHRVCRCTLRIAIPLGRMPEGLQDDPRAQALRRMCQENGIGWTHTLSPNENLGGPVYDCTLTVDNLVEE